MIISNNKWNDTIENRISSTKISLDKIEFNDNPLLIDNDNNKIYYSIVNSNTKYNPTISYDANKKAKLSINSKLNDSILESDSIKIMIYNENEYRIYSLIVTEYPIINIKYKTETTNDVKTPIILEVFDNHTKSFQRLIKSDGYLKTIEENQEYIISLVKESLGNNKRENHISIFGMSRQDEYRIRKVNDNNRKDKYVQVFINNQYNGLYLFRPIEERRSDIFEQNK